MMESKLDAGDFILEQYESRYYKATLKTGYATMLGTGTAVTKTLIIPFAHRWQSTHFTHHTAAEVDSNAKLNILIRRPKLKNTPTQFEEDFLRLDQIVAPRVSDTWGDSFERERSIYDVIMD